MVALTRDIFSIAELKGLFYVESTGKQKGGKAVQLKKKRDH